MQPPIVGEKLAIMLLTPPDDRPGNVPEQCPKLCRIGNARACGNVAATPSLNGVCGRRPWRAAGRDEETVPRSNKETAKKGRNCRRGSGLTAWQLGRPPLPTRPGY
jgi:hypothetical protein